MPKAYDIVGWALNGATYCTTCKPAPVVEYSKNSTHDEAHPIFACDATVEDVCDSCLTPLEDA